MSFMINVGCFKVLSLHWCRNHKLVPYFTLKRPEHVKHKYVYLRLIYLDACNKKKITQRLVTTGAKYCNFYARLKQIQICETLCKRRAHGMIGCQPPDLTCSRLNCVTALMQSSELMAAVSPLGVYFWRQRTAAFSICTEQIEPDSGATSCIQSICSEWNILRGLWIYSTTKLEVFTFKTDKYRNDLTTEFTQPQQKHTNKPTIWARQQ